MDVMTTKPVTVDKDINLTNAAKLMEESNINSLLIIEKDNAIGIITDEDIVRNVVARGLDPKKIKIKDVMKKDLVYISPGADVYKALLLMRDNNIRQLPVMENEKLKGYLTLKDILKIQPELIDLIMEKYSLEEQQHEHQTYQKDFFPELKNKKIKNKN